MELRRLLASVGLLFALVVTKSAAQDCGLTVDINSSGLSGPNGILVDVTGGVRLCLRCISDGTILPVGETVPETTWTILPFTPDTETLSRGQFSSDGTIENDEGILVINQPQNKIMDGFFGYRVECSASQFAYLNNELYSATFLPPDAGNPIFNATFGTTATRLCLNNNPPPYMSGTTWENSTGGLVSVSRVLQFINTRDANAGEYTCVVTTQRMPLPNPSRLTSTVTVVVQFAPRVTTSEDPTENVHLGATLDLTCFFQSIPDPNLGVFLRDGVALDETDDRVSVVTTDSMSTLTLTAIRGDEGGEYNCSLTNDIGTTEIPVTTVTVFVPPEPVANLTAADITEDTITITWINGFDGNTPITGARIEYVEEGGTVQIEMIPDDDDPTTFILTGLTPFASHDISVFLDNIVGRSDPTTITATTLSLFLEAPLNLAVTAISSTVLEATWEAPADLLTTDDPLFWTVEISLTDGTNRMQQMTNSSDITTVRFPELDKGTLYQIRVAGNNVRGEGAFTDYMERQTLVDPPTEPQNVNAMGLSSFALNVTWEAPLDNGGRPVDRYVIIVNETTLEAGAMTRSLLVRNTDDAQFLTQNTTYEVSVAAMNEQGTGPAATAMGTTLAITEPQPILDRPIPDEETITNISITISWTEAEGDVDEYLIQYVRRLNEIVFNVTVNGSLTSFTLTGLEPDTTYSVAVFTVNSNGLSIASPLAQFTTALPPPPTLNGPDVDLMEGQSFILTCTSPDLSEPIMWLFMEEEITHNPPMTVITGEFGTSSLTIMNAQVANDGMYVCEVGDTRSNFTVIIIMATDPTDGIDTQTIIIAACVGGGGLIILLIIIGIMICCCCCGRSNNKDSSAKFDSKALKPNKRTNELFEVSTGASYVPVSDRGVHDTGVSFNMPEDYQAHSSFNTLDKPPKRSSSPEVAVNTSSFGVTNNTSTDNLTGGVRVEASPPRYQDMPPRSDGTML